MFHLPGEPLYLAAAFRYLPGALLPYIHVPVIVVLLFSASWVALRLGGPAVAAAVGAIAILQPFILLHGSVWDDTILGAACEWSVFALMMAAIGSRGGTTGSERLVRVAAIAVLAGFAAVTRSSAQSLLVLVGLSTIVLQPLRSIRMEGVAAICGVCLALCFWGYRNYSVSGEFLVGTSHDGITLWESNYPWARESVLTKGQTEGMNAERMVDDYEKTDSMTEWEANRYFIRRATEYMAAHPGDVALTAGLKVVVGLFGFRMHQPLLSPRNFVGASSNLILLVLAIAGAMMPGFTAGRAEILLWRCMLIVLLLSYAGFSVIGPIGLRYRMSLEPALWIGAAVAVTQVAKRLLDRFAGASSAPAHS
jgi:hypothetical protein